MASIRSQTNKSKLHPRNRNREPYDLSALAKTIPALKSFVKQNKYDTESIDFANPIAVKLLNRAILDYYYGIKHWDFPDQNLCPPIPGRADYLHYMADLLSGDHQGQIPLGQQVVGLDIGIGASCIYPIIGVVEYDWQFVGSEIDPRSFEAAVNIINANPALQNKIEVRRQPNLKNSLKGIITEKDQFDFTICNPPFHANQTEASKATLRKVKNLTRKNVKSAKLNFSGVQNELIYPGGELNFIKLLIFESRVFTKRVHWFSTLVSKATNLPKIENYLTQVKPTKVKVIPMGTGNKVTRIVAWTYLTQKEQSEWRKRRWGN